MAGARQAAWLGLAAGTPLLGVLTASWVTIPPIGTKLLAAGLAGMLVFAVRTIGRAALRSASPGTVVALACVGAGASAVLAVA